MIARALICNGALWNSFIFAARPETLCSTFLQSYPELFRVLHMAWCDCGGRLRCDSLAALYQTLQDVDFSRDILQRNPHRLRAQRVPECGWTDLGTPRRVMECLEHAGSVDAQFSPTRNAQAVGVNLPTAAQDIMSSSRGL